jgi:hypothetical protein
MRYCMMIVNDEMTQKLPYPVLRYNFVYSSEVLRIITKTSAKILPPCHTTQFNNRIITGCRSRYSCRNVFKNLKIIPLQSLYILSFVVNNKNKFKLNSDVYNINMN